MLQSVNLQQVLVLDIETVPQYQTYAQVPENMSTLWAQKSLYQRKNNETAEDYYPRAGIWAEFGKIICISIGMFTANGLRIKSFASHHEAEILVQFADLLSKQNESLILCAHNGKEFDFPYLCRRMLINGIPIPSQLDLTGKKPWEINHLDTMELWKFGDYKNYTSLDLLAQIFGIPTPKDDINGADVYRIYWEENDLERIKNYCQKDVITTAQLLRKFKYLPLLSDDQIVIVT